MTEPERWQVSTDAAEVYESCFVPAIFGAWASRVADADEFVVAVRQLLVTFVGPRRLWVVARVDIDDSLRGDEVEALTRSIESGLEARSPYITRVDVVPVGQGGPPDQDPRVGR